MKISISLSVVLLVFVASFSAAHQKVAVIPLHSAKQLKNIVTVSPTGGDFTDPATALASITDASSSNIYHVAIGPGTYVITQQMVMKPFLSITGSGPATTIIKGAISTAVESTSSLIVGADNSSLSDLMVENNCSGTFCLGIYNNGSPIIHDVAVFASGGDRNYAIYNYSSSPVFYDVSAKGTGGDTAAGIYNNGASPIMADIAATGSGGVESEGMINAYGSSAQVNSGIFTGSGGSFNFGVGNSGSNIIFRNSFIKGSTDGIYTDGGTIRVLQSSVVGGANTVSGTLTCITSDNGVSALIAPNCN